VARWRDDAEPVPERLARFVVEEWPGADPAGQWGAACRAWLAEHPGRGLPLGGEDPVEIRRWVVALRARLAEAGHPAPGPPLRGPGEYGPWDD
jgi:hypothetical protein